MRTVLFPGPTSIEVIEGTPDTTVVMDTTVYIVVLADTTATPGHVDGEYGHDIEQAGDARSTSAFVRPILAARKLYGCFRHNEGNAMRGKSKWFDHI